MYLAHFGLAQAPFSIAPDPHFLFMSERHREALAHLVYGASAGGGVVLLSGEIGAGKTTVCRGFLAQLPELTRVAYVFNPKLSVVELLQTVCDEWTIEVRHAPGEAPSVKTYTDALNAFLLQAHAQGATCLLVIDEAQNLDAEVLEQLRLLTNLETDERKLLQIVLIGQPELRDLLARPELEQLAQRIVARFHLEALSESETRAYVGHRLAVGGLTGVPPFDDAALRLIHCYSRGVPRRINLVCDRSLLGAYGQGRRQVDAATVKQAAHEVFDLRSTGALRRNLAAGVVGTLTLVLGVGALWWFNGGASRGEVPDAPASTAASGASAVAPSRGPVPANLAASGSPPASQPPAASGLAEPVASGPSEAASASMGASAVPGAASEPGAAANPLAPASVSTAEKGGAAAIEFSTVVWPSEDGAWRALADHWQSPVAATTEVCETLARRQLGCQRWRGGLGQIRLIDRPVILAVKDRAGQTGWVVWLGWAGDRIELLGPHGRQAWSLGQLLPHWQGEFATLWRMPAGFTGLVMEGQRGPAVQVLADGLARWDEAASPASAPARFDTDLGRRLRAFQAAQGLTPDGLAGPTTFMLLNRAVGVDEPRLLLAR